MCRPVQCRICGKTTWAGCGEHVEQVLATVPAGERCPGHPDRDRKAGVLRRLFHRT